MASFICWAFPASSEHMSLAPVPALRFPSPPTPPMEGNAGEGPKLAALLLLTSSPRLGRVRGGILCYFLFLPAAVWLSNGLSALRHATSSTSALFFSGFLGRCEVEEIRRIMAAFARERRNVTGTFQMKLEGGLRWRSRSPHQPLMDASPHLVAVKHL